MAGRRSDGWPAPGERLTQEIVQRLLAYDPETGELHWREGHKHRVGKRAGTVLRGRRRIYLAGRYRPATHVIWLHVFGVEPIVDIDHINLDAADDRLKNLRLASRAENSANKLATSANTSGYKGVNYSRSNRRWKAEITKNGTKYHLGYFDTPYEAHLAYTGASRALNGKFSRVA